MEELLAHPAFQAAVAPLGAALVLGAALRQTRLLGLALGAAFLLVIGLTIGYSFEPLTAMRKLVLVGLATTLMIPVLELGQVLATAKVRAAIAALVAAAAVWIVWRVLQQKPAADAALAAAGAALYAALMVESGLRVSNEPIRSAAASAVLCLAVGVLALLGASAVLGQVGIALFAGAGAVLMVLLVGARAAPLGWTLALPAPVIGGGALLAVVATGLLPWYCLVPTLAVPWATRFVNVTGPRWRSELLSVAAALVPAVAAIVLAWFATRVQG